MKMKRREALGIFGLLGGALSLGVLGGWGGVGHAAITKTAIDLLPDDAPPWLREASTMEQIAYQSNEPDRWRGTPRDALRHENSPDHYIDVELLVPMGMTLRTAPPMRYDFVMAIGRMERPVASAEGEEREDLTPERIGLLPWAIAEHHAKLVSSMRTLRILEAIEDPARAHEMDAARANVIREMGQLSHFVADGAQPLHTTIHHHGWVGPNPEGYTTDYGIHSEIDTGVVERHALDHEGLTRYAGALRAIGASEADKREATLALIERSHAQLKPLYRMERAGLLREREGKAFIAGRMADAAATLAGLYDAAWRAAAPTPESIESFLTYNPSPPLAE